MPERIPELDQMADEAREVTMLPATEIRRRGDLRRTTRTVSVTAGIVIVALAAGFGLWQSPLLDSYRNPDWAATPPPVPTETTDEPAEVPTWENSPTAEMLFYDYAPGEIQAEYEGLGEAGHGLCDPGQYAEPSTILTRAYGTPGYPPYMDAIVFGYDSAEAATEGFDLIKAEAVNCQRAMEEAHGLIDPRTYDVTDQVPFDPTIVDASPVRMGYVTYVGRFPDSDSGMFGQTVVLQAGERVLWLTQAFEGMDDNCAPAPTEHAEQCPLPASIPDVLPRLVGQ